MKSNWYYHALVQNCIQKAIQYIAGNVQHMTHAIGISQQQMQQELIGIAQHNLNGISIHQQHGNIHVSMQQAVSGIKFHKGIISQKY